MLDVQTKQNIPLDLKRLRDTIPSLVPDRLWMPLPIVVSEYQFQPYEILDVYCEGLHERHRLTSLLQS